MLRSCKGKPKSGDNARSQEEGKDRSSSGALREPGTADTLILNFLPPKLRKLMSIVPSHPDCAALSQQSWETDAMGHEHLPYQSAMRMNQAASAGAHPATQGRTDFLIKRSKEEHLEQ